MEYRLLGPLEAWARGRSLDLGGPTQRRVLAALLLHPNRVVSLDQLIEAVWDDDPPVTARQQTRNRVSALRRRLTPGGGFVDTDEAADGYRLRVAPGELDLDRFEDLVEVGRTVGDPSLLRKALALWRGPALAGMDGSCLRRAAGRLDEQRLAAVENCLALQVAGREHGAAVVELAALVAEHPLRERLVGLLMTALAGCGRREEALAVYRALAARLAEALGIEPSPRLRSQYEEMRGGGALGGAVVPAQLPREVPGFAGRVDELSALDRLIRAGRSGQIVISAIAGTAGVGKTALAVHWAHRIRHRFPDGQLYANLRGFDPSGAVVSAESALRGFLTALSVPPQQIPADLDRQTKLYRSLVAGRRMLIVLDNARNPDQVQPLLPDSPNCLVLITSRSQLAGHAGLAGQSIVLDLLTEDESRLLLANRLGFDRVTAEPGAINRIIARAARLPLALAIVAARASDSGASLSVLAADLDRQRGLGAFTAGDPHTDMRAVFSWSYAAVSPAAARLFRLLGTHPGADLAVAAAASLAGTSVEEAARLLDELARARLLHETVPGRFAFHDLLRTYAAELAEGDTELVSGMRRLLDHYLQTAFRAAMRLNPHRDPITLPAPGRAVTVVDLPTLDDARAWYENEYHALLGAIQYAARHGFDAQAWQLSWTLVTFLHWSGSWQELVATHLTALAAVRRIGDKTAEAQTHRGLAGAYHRLDRHDETRTHLVAALDLFTDTGDRLGQANTQHLLALSFDRQREYENAIHYDLTAVEGFAATGQRSSQARALSAVGWYCVQLGRHAEALAYCQQSLELLQELGDRLGEAATWDSLGYTHHRLGQYCEAVTCYERSVALIHEVGDRPNEANALDHLGDAHRSAGDVPAARDAWIRAVTILDALGLPEVVEVRAKLEELGGSSIP